MSSSQPALDRTSGVYAEPRLVTRLEDCYFYHTTDIPGYGRVEGEWDLGKGIDAYLGNVDFKGKRVLELGTASGFINFHMESKGAEVVGYDLSDKQDWDVVPFARYDYEGFQRERKEHIRRTNNAYWLCHRAFQSRGKMVYGDIYSVPSDIGLVDISTFGSILLHVRDPFLALQRALSLTRETAIVTDRAGLFSPWTSLRPHRKRLPGSLAGPSQNFLPDWHTSQPVETWWRLSPQLIQRFLGVLGFEQSKVTYHRQEYRGRFFRGRRLTLKLRQFTVVGHRTVPLRP